MTGPSRRTWDRLERRAIRAHERDLLRRLRDLADEAPAVTAIELNRLQLAHVVVDLGGTRVVLAGISARTATITGDLIARPNTLRVGAAGRYRPAWWIALDDGTRLHHLAGARLQLRPHRGPDGHLLTDPVRPGYLVT